MGRPPGSPNKVPRDHNPPVTYQGLTDAHLMTLTGVSITTKRNMELRGVFKRNEDLSWDAQACISGYIEWLKKRHGASGDMDGKDITDPEQEFRKQKARQARMQADQMEGKLIDAGEVARQWENHVYAAKSKLTALPDKMVAELLPLLAEGTRAEEVRDPVKRMIDEALEELSKDQELDEDEELEDGAEEPTDD